MNTGSKMSTRRELTGYLDTLLDPLLPLAQKDPSAPIPLGHMPVYGKNASRCEAFSRILWGLAPAIAGNIAIQNREAWLELIVRGFTAGCDPAQPQYWGKTPAEGSDQRYVEMCAMAYSFLIAGPAFWDALDRQTQQNVFAWFSPINRQDHAVVNNNWRFFRIFVNAFFEKYLGPCHKEQCQKDFEEIDSMYLGEGWYSDGHTEQRDYYIPMAMHFYGLLYSALVAKNQDYIDRAQAFSLDFLAWFDSEGSALPFGRSLTYRFAQGAFWAAFIMADACSDAAVSLAEAKGLLMRHLRSWFSKAEIYDPGGILTVGYNYPNLYMSESYNATGSPYWAQKIFAILLLPESHPFWTSPEQELPREKEHYTQKHPRMLLQRNRQGDIKCLNAGQWAGFEPNHTREKYAKFSYATLFGFNVSLQAEGLERYAADSMLSFSPDQQFWTHRAKTSEHQVDARGVASSYTPFSGLQVRTLLYAIDAAWHLRIHTITAAQEVYFLEGAYSLPFNYEQDPEVYDVVNQNGKAIAKSYYKEKNLFSAIYGLNYRAEGKLIAHSPNMNLVAPYSISPVLLGHIPRGKIFLLSLCGGDLVENYSDPEYSHHVHNGILRVKSSDTEHKISLQEWKLL